MRNICLALMVIAMLSAMAVSEVIFKPGGGIVICHPSGTGGQIKVCF